jgi:hypothetical protein
MGSTDVSKAHADSQLPSNSGASPAGCAGKTKGACAAIRVRDGSMPQGAALSDADKKELADLLDAWVTAGQKQ